MDRWTVTTQVEIKKCQKPFQFDKGVNGIKNNSIIETNDKIYQTDSSFLKVYLHSSTYIKIIVTSVCFLTCTILYA